MPEQSKRTLRVQLVERLRSLDEMDRQRFLKHTDWSDKQWNKVTGSHNDPNSLQESIFELAEDVLLQMDRESQLGRYKVCQDCGGHFAWTEQSCPRDGADLRVRTNTKVTFANATSLRESMTQAINKLSSRSSAVTITNSLDYCRTFNPNVDQHLAQFDQEAFPSAPFGAGLVKLFSWQPKYFDIACVKGLPVGFMDMFLLKAYSLDSPKYYRLSRKLSCNGTSPANDIMPTPEDIMQPGLVLSPGSSTKHKLVDAFVEAVATSPRNRRFIAVKMMLSLIAKLRSDPDFQGTRVRKISTVAVAERTAPRVHKQIGTQHLRLCPGEAWAFMGLMEPGPSVCSFDSESFEAVHRQTVFSATFPDGNWPLLCDVLTISATQILEDNLRQMTPKDAREQVCQLLGDRQ